MKLFKLLITTVLFVLSSATAFSADEYIVKMSPENVEGAKTISNSEAKALFDNGALFVDVRSKKAYAKGRIPDALFLDLKSGFTKEALLEEAALTDPVIIYCQSPPHSCPHVAMNVN